MCDRCTGGDSTSAPTPRLTSIWAQPPKPRRERKFSGPDVSWSYSWRLRWTCSPTRTVDDRTSPARIEISSGPPGSAAAARVSAGPLRREATRFICHQCRSPPGLRPLINSLLKPRSAGAWCLREEAAELGEGAETILKAEHAEHAEHAENYSRKLCVLCDRRVESVSACSAFEPCPRPQGTSR